MVSASKHLAPAMPARGRMGDLRMRIEETIAGALAKWDHAVENDSFDAEYEAAIGMADVLRDLKDRQVSLALFCEAMIGRYETLADRHEDLTGPKSGDQIIADMTAAGRLRAKADAYREVMLQIHDPVPASNAPPGLGTAALPARPNPGDQRHAEQDVAIGL